jgi:hypothetical protein
MRTPRRRASKMRSCSAASARGSDYAAARPAGVRIAGQSGSGQRRRCQYVDGHAAFHSTADHSLRVMAPQLRAKSGHWGSPATRRLRALNCGCSFTSPQPFETGDVAGVFVYCIEAVRGRRRSVPARASLGRRCGPAHLGLDGIGYDGRLAGLGALDTDSRKGKAPPVGAG